MVEEREATHVGLSHDALLFNLQPKRLHRRIDYTW